MSRDILIKPLTAEAFAPFGDVIEPSGEPTVMINRGKCGRYHDIAALDFVDGQAGISIFEGEPYELPLALDLMERHPLGSQAFLPLSAQPYLVIVAEDAEGTPDTPHAFLANSDQGVNYHHQGVNYHRNTWHGVLTPLNQKALFAVVDRIGEGNNLQEHTFDTPYRIVK